MYCHPSIEKFTLRRPKYWKVHVEGPPSIENLYWRPPKFKTAFDAPQISHFEAWFLTLKCSLKNLISNWCRSYGHFGHFTVFLQVRGRIWHKETRLIRGWSVVPTWYVKYTNAVLYTLSLNFFLKTSQKQI